MKKLILFFIVFFINTIIFAQQNLITLIDSVEEVSIGKKVYILEDKRGVLMIDDIQKPENQAKFVISEKEYLQFAKFNQWYWIKITIQNNSLKNDWLLNIAETKIKTINLYFQDTAQQWQCIKNGFNVPVNRKFKKQLHQLFPLKFTDTSTTFYIHLQGTITTFPLKINTIDTVEEDLITLYFMYGLYLGIMLFIFFNNLVFGLLTKTVNHLLYCGVVINYIIVVLGGHGYVNLLLNMPIDLAKFASLFTLSSGIFILLYIKRSLNIQNKTLLGKIFITLTVFAIASFCIGIFIETPHILLIAESFLVITFPILIFVAINALKKGDKFAGYYLVAFSVFALFVACEISYLNSGTPPYFYLAHGSWGILSEIIILAYGLNKKFDFEQKQLQKAKVLAQEEMLKQLKENARLIEAQNEILEEKVKTRTSELYQTNEELATTNEELYQTQEEILAQRDLLENKNNLLEQYTHKIGKSIGAAQMIQNAILPPKAKMKELFEEHFVLFKPKDVVSGDFWWANEINGEKYLIVADCTGHGVSGAMLTMIGSALLDRIIRLLGITDPAEILTTLHEEIKAVLQQDQTQNNEGMDIAIAHWHYENEDCFLSFAAAKRPLIYAYQGQIEKIVGTRRNIGGKIDSIKLFETKTFTFPKGTYLYLCSDGYGDQNDVARNNFSEKRLINLLQEIQLLQMGQQKEILQEQLHKHMEGTEQRDDILVIGVRV